MKAVVSFLWRMEEGGLEDTEIKSGMAGETEGGELERNEEPRVWAVEP